MKVNQYRHVKCTDRDIYNRAPICSEALTGVLVHKRIGPTVKKSVAGKVSKRLSASKRFPACCKTLNLTSHILQIRLGGLCEGVVAPTPKNQELPGAAGVAQTIARVYCGPFSAERLRDTIGLQYLGDDWSLWLGARRHRSSPPHVCTLACFVHFAVNIMPHYRLPCVVSGVQS